jgi:hypothetical protein
VEKLVHKTTVPEQVTLRSFAETLLADLKDPYPARDSAANLGRRIDRALGRDEGGHHVRLVILNEAQRFSDSRWTDLYNCANFLRDRIEQSGSCFLLSGLAHGTALLEQNEQLQRLFGETIQIAPFRWDDAEERKQFRGILKVIKASLVGSYEFHQVSHQSEGRKI